MDRLGQNGRGEFLLQVEIDRAVLQRLETADGLAELHPRPHVVETQFERAAHHPYEFRTCDHRRPIERLRERRARDGG